jgi:hypothetical protein
MDSEENMSTTMAITKESMSRTALLINGKENARIGK